MDRRVKPGDDVERLEQNVRDSPAREGEESETREVDGDAA
jgi:hypothetical protein